MSIANTYYYWSTTFCNENGDNLEICFNKFGTGTQVLPFGENFIMEVVYLDERKDFGNSWCLRCYNKQTGKNIPVGLYEKNPDEKIYGNKDLNPI